MRERPPSPADRIAVVFVVALAIFGAGLAASAAYDQIHRESIRSEVLRSWTPARRLVAARLKQHEPLEFGAVWATHSGLICGLVNGWGSFGGLTGMTPFFVDRGRATFALDVSQLEFSPNWRQCIRDPWITILDGSTQTGYCATRRGQSRCVTAGE